MSEKLLPCPFCGGEARLTAAMGETWMRCIDCNAGSEMSGSRALAIAAWNRRAPAPEGEAWGYATRRIAFADGTKVDGPWGLDTGLSLDMARTDPCWEVQPLYASPVVPVGSGEPVARATCQDCGGHIEGWICQSCDRQFRENDAGNLVFEDQPVVPVGVSTEVVENLRRQRDHPTSDTLCFTTIRTCDADAIIAALRPTDTGANHD